MMKRSQDKNPGGNRKLPLWILLSAGILLLCTGIVAARYYLSSSQSGIISAKNFYFTSNMLKEETESAKYVIDSQKSSFCVEIYNYADEKRVSADEIKYKVTVTGGMLTGSAEKDGTGSLTGGTKSTGKIEVQPDSSAAEIIVTVESTSPYQKKLTAVFTPGDGSTCMVEDTSGKRAAVLTMVWKEMSAERNNKVAITLPAGVVPDQADEHVSYESGTYYYSFPEKGVYSLVLLKKDIKKQLGLEGTGIFTNAITVNSK